MKKVLIQNNEQLELVWEEIRVSSSFSHRNLLPLLDHAIISVKPTQEGSWNHEAYLLFPVHLDGTLLDNFKAMSAKNDFFSTSDVLQIFRQVKRVAAGLLHSACIDETGSLFVFGDKVVANLGFGEAKNATMPSMINTFPYSEEVACGGYHTCVVTIR